MKTSVRLAYFAGFYEGEGYVTNDISNNNRMRLGIDQNDPTPLYLAQKIWGGSVRKRVRKSPVSSKICTCYTWRLCHTDTVMFLKDIRPYMMIPYKITQVNVAIIKSTCKLNRRFKCRYCTNKYTHPSGRRRHEKQSHPLITTSETKHKMELFTC